MPPLWVPEQGQGMREGALSFRSVPRTGGGRLGDTKTSEGPLRGADNSVNRRLTSDLRTLHEPRRASAVLRGCPPTPALVGHGPGRTDGPDWQAAHSCFSGMCCVSAQSGRCEAQAGVRQTRSPGGDQAPSTPGHLGGPGPSLERPPPAPQPEGAGPPHGQWPVTPVAEEEPLAQVITGFLMFKERSVSSVGKTTVPKTEQNDPRLQHRKHRAGLGPQLHIRNTRLTQTETPRRQADAWCSLFPVQMGADSGCPLLPFPRPGRTACPGPGPSCPGLTRAVCSAPHLTAAVPFLSAVRAELRGTGLDHHLPRSPLEEGHHRGPGSARNKGRGTSWRRCPCQGTEPGRPGVGPEDGPGRAWEGSSWAPRD